MFLLLVSQQLVPVTLAWTALPLSFSVSSTRQSATKSTMGVVVQQSLQSPFGFVKLHQKPLLMTESSSHEPSAENNSNANGEQDINKGEAVDAVVPNLDNTDTSNEDEVVTEITASLEEATAAAADEAAAAVAAEVTALKDEIAALETSLKAQRRKVMQVSDEADEYTKSGYARQVAAMENMRRARSVRIECVCDYVQRVCVFNRVRQQHYVLWWHLFP
jgi:hypothetical protein